MTFLIITVLLAVMQTSPPVPRKTADSATSSSKSIKHESGNQQPSPARAIATSQTDKQSGDAPSDAHAQETIVVRKSAPMPKAGKDWWDRAYVVFTGLLVAIGAYGVCMAKRTLGAIERQAKANEDQLTEIRESAEKTDRMILIAAQEAENGKAATEAAKKSADAARESIILTHRPRLIIRDLVVAWRALLFRGTCVKKLNENNFEDWQLGGAFYIVNVGNQTATVVTCEQFLSFDEMLPLERPVESGVRKNVAIRLRPGQAQRIPFHPIAIGEADTRTLTQGVPMMAIGRIVYEDELGNRRETGFARKFDMRRLRFTAIDDPDYEYVD